MSGPEVRGLANARPAESGTQRVIGRIAYAVETGKLMVRVPTERGRWVLTDRCVAYTECPMCKAVPGEPCLNPRLGNYLTTTHWARRTAFTRGGRGRGGPVVVEGSS